MALQNARALLMSAKILAVLAIDEVARAAKSSGAEVILTTEKDMVRLGDRPHIVAVPLEVVVEPAFKPWLAERLQDRYGIQLPSWALEQHMMQNSTRRRSGSARLSAVSSPLHNASAIARGSGEVHPVSDTSAGVRSRVQRQSPLWTIGLGSRSPALSDCVESSASRKVSPTSV